MAGWTLPAPPLTLAIGNGWTGLALLAAAIALAIIGFRLGRGRAVALVDAGKEPLATPDYYGWYVVAWAFLPITLITAALGVFVYGGLIVARATGAFIDADTGDAIESVTSLAFLGDAAWPGWTLLAAWLVVPAALLPIALGRVRPEVQARHLVERCIYGVLLTAASISVVTTAAIAASVVFESLAFFTHPAVDVTEFLFGTTWNPGASFTGDADKARFGAVPLFFGTLMITAIAMVVAVPTGVLAAVFLAEYASLPVRRVAKPMLEILAGIPTVVYGFFAAVTVAPLVVATTETITAFAQALGWSSFELTASFENALTAGGIMGVMIIPFMSSLSDDVISAVPQALRRGAYAMGATRAECIIRVVLPAALPGIVSAFLLAISRAIGETMIVVMAAGLNPSITINPLEQVTTVTVHIVSNLTGDLAFDNPQTLSAFSLGLVLLVMTLGLNVISSVIIRRFKAQYD
ncbi:MAG: phosphate ABC transporter permease subunit PstC [Planctomycetota bacterium]